MSSKLKPSNLLFFRSKSQQAIARRNKGAYKALRNGADIRLVRILPGPSYTALECELISSSIDMLDYEALSYAWGNTAFEFSITLNGSTFTVTESLYLALRHLRKEDTSRILWIDAICINQMDNKERSHQVQQMRRVYENAKCVIVWLGLAPLGIASLIAVADLEGTGEVELKDWEIGRVLDDLSTRSWWERMWVVQEITVARTAVVQCGHHTFPWLTFCKLVKQCPQLTERFRRDVESLRALQTDLRHTGGREGLLELAYKFKDRLATDPRDKLFALVGLVGKNDPPLIVPDYSKDMKTVSREFGKAWIQHYGSLIILAHPKLRGLTPWNDLDQVDVVQFWNHVGVDQVPFSRGMNLFSASGSSTLSSCAFSANEDIIVLKCFWADTVAYLNSAPGYEWPIKSPECLWEFVGTTLKQWEDEGIPKRYPVMEKALHQALTAGLYDELPDCESEHQGYFDAVQTATFSRCPFITTSGYIGISDWKARAGDIVGTFLGSKVPLMLFKESRALREEKIVGPQDETIYYKRLKDILGEDRAMRLFKQGFHSLHGIVGQAYVQEKMQYYGDIQDDIAMGRIHLQEYYLAACDGTTARTRSGATWVN